MIPASYIHILSLDTIGGVESLYVHFITEALSRKTANHFTSVCGKPPHKNLATRFNERGYNTFLEEHIMGIRVPRLFRPLIRLRRAMVHDIVKPALWIFWNRIESSPPPGRSVYYEHGASWNVAVTQKGKKFLASCSSFIANSNAARIILKDKWDVRASTTVLPNPLRPDIPIVDSARTAPSFRPLHLGFIGRLVPAKGILVALHSLKVLRDRGVDATLSVAGVGSLEEVCKRCAKEIGVDSFVVWNGCLHDVASFYDSIDVLLVPSLREPLGLVSLEAAARGVPVIAAAVDGLPEAVLDGKTGVCLRPTLAISEARDLLIGHDRLPDLVVDPQTATLRPPMLVDPRCFADAIEHLSEDPERYEQYSSNALIHAQSRSDFHSYFNTFQNILECSAEQPQSDT